MKAWVSFNGNRVYINRDWLPQDVTYEGTLRLEGRLPFSYKVTQTIARGDPALERDELEGILTLQNNAAHNAVADRGDLIRDSKARRLRRLARSREWNAGDS